VAANLSVKDYGFFYSAIFKISLINQFLTMGLFEYFVKYSNKISRNIIIHISFLMSLMIFIFSVDICMGGESKNSTVEFYYAILNIFVLIISSILIANNKFTYVLKNSIFMGIIKLIIFYFIFKNFDKKIDILFHVIIVIELMSFVSLFIQYLKIKKNMELIEKINISNYFIFFRREIFPFLIIGITLYLFLSFDRIILIQFGDLFLLGGYFFTYQLFFSPYIVIGAQLFDYLITFFTNEKHGLIKIRDKLLLIILINYIGAIILSFIILYLFDSMAMHYINDRNYLMRDYFLLFTLSACNVVNIKIINIYHIISDKIGQISKKTSLSYLLGIIILYISYLQFNILGVIYALYILTSLILLYCVIDIYIVINEEPN
jgi:O-antigen/teichoic acid export membrane protein